MNILFEPVRRNRAVFHSKRLNRSLSCIAHLSFAELSVQSNTVVLTSGAAPGALAEPLPLPDAICASGDLVACEELSCDAQAITGFAERADVALDGVARAGQTWHGFRMAFASGVEDRIWLLTRNAGQKIPVRGLLGAIWPVLREDCLHDLHAQESETGDQALLWMISSEINVSILVMNKVGQMLRANAAAKRLLSQEIVLRRTPHGIRCVNDGQTRLFRSSLEKCACSNPGEGDQIVFLDAGRMDMRIPVTMSRYHHDGLATDLVLVTMPLPPDSRRVEMLARAGGLTPAEARIAALLQMGLSNKDAALAAGLKEQSVSTYAKRALNKLNVTSRAEMAQMLTWQAAGGTLS